MTRERAEKLMKGEAQPTRQELAVTLASSLTWAWNGGSLKLQTLFSCLFGPYLGRDISSKEEMEEIDWETLKVFSSSGVPEDRGEVTCPICTNDVAVVETEEGIVLCYSNETE